MRRINQIPYTSVASSTDSVEDAAEPAFILFESHRIDLLSFLPHTLITWSEMGKQWRRSNTVCSMCFRAIILNSEMAHYCCVLNCFSNSKTSELSFHGISKDPKLRKLSFISRCLVMMMMMMMMIMMMMMMMVISSDV